MPEIDSTASNPTTHPCPRRELGSEGSHEPVSYDDILRSSALLAPWVHRTPVLTSSTLDARCCASIFMKCENFQKIGAFKFRGAMNALLNLPESARKTGVVTHSSGNHAQALAKAGGLLGIPVTIVMPRTAPAVKRVATEGYGARIVLCEPTLASREEAVAQEIRRHGLALVHPFNDPHVIAGQGTIGLELLAARPETHRASRPSRRHHGAGRRRRSHFGDGPSGEGTIARNPGRGGRARECG